MSTKDFFECLSLETETLGPGSVLSWLALCWPDCGAIMTPDPHDNNQCKQTSWNHSVKWYIYFYQQATFKVMQGIQHSLMAQSDVADPCFNTCNKDHLIYIYIYKYHLKYSAPPSLNLMSQPTACLIGWGCSPPAVCNQEHLGVRITWHPQGTHAHLDIYIQSAVHL